MNNKEEVFVTNGFEETQRLGEKFIGDVLRLHLEGASSNIALYGDLGRVKTTFVQGMAKGLGIKRRIISPTYIIVRSYKITIKHQVLGIKYFYHIDLYRVEGRGIEGLGLEEIMEDTQNIVVIEWAEKLGDLLPKKRWDVGLEYLGEDKRKITIKKHG